MRNLIIPIFIWLMNIYPLDAQTKYLVPPLYSDSKSIDSLIFPYANNKFRSVVYIPRNTDLYTSILLIDDTDSRNIKYWCLKNDSILFCDTISIKDDSIFRYKSYKMAGVKENDKLASDTFIPPIMSESNTEALIYKDNKMTFYFEYGKNVVTHLENDKNTMKYREKWLEIIREELNDILAD